MNVGCSVLVAHDEDTTCGLCLGSYGSSVQLATRHLTSADPSRLKGSVEQLLPQGNA